MSTDEEEAKSEYGARMVFKNGGETVVRRRRIVGPIEECRNCGGEALIQYVYLDSEEGDWWCGDCEASEVVP